MAKYCITASTAYRAQSFNDEAFKDIKKEPWLHVRLVSILKPGKNGGKSQVKWYAVVYVWDTREVVQVIEQNGFRQQRNYEKALDNGKPLKDKQRLMPGWMRDKLASKTSPDKVTQNGPYDL